MYPQETNARAAQPVPTFQCLHRGRRLRADLPTDIDDALADKSFVVAIDGPAGAGKSTASRLLAERLGFEFLDTGAMYRCVTLAALQSQVNLRDQAAVMGLASGLVIRLEPQQVTLNGIDVSEAIRAPEVSASIGAIADNEQVRALLSRWQREWAGGKRVVTEGRDQGTVVFHDSPCKIYLTASDEERARRRCEELNAKGIEARFEDVLAQQQQRDREDTCRAVGGLKRADDAELVLTDGMTLEQVVDRLIEIVRSRVATLSKGHTSRTGHALENRS